jgi:hypothetical protein
MIIAKNTGLSISKALAIGTSKRVQWYQSTGDLMKFAVLAVSTGLPPFGRLRYNPDAVGAPCLDNRFGKRGLERAGITAI